jgi:hypothetical protein
MSKGTRTNNKRDSGRDAGGFVALPWSVLDSAAYSGLSHPARSLLMEFARQYVRDNNGRLLASGAYLAKRGWFSAGAIQKAKLELIAAGFIHEMVMGHRPNKASWYAITWQTLDRIPGYDVGAAETFQRSAYRTAPAKPKRPAPKCKRNKKVLTPPHGIETSLIAPPHGVREVLPTPPHGAISPTFCTLSTPPHGNHLEKPSIAVGSKPGIAAAGLRGQLACTGHADRHHWLTQDQIGFIANLTAAQPLKH